MLKCSLISRVLCSRRDIFHFISHPMGVKSNERWVISVKRMNNPFFFRNKLWVIAANDRKNSWTGVTRKDRHESMLVCLLGNCDIWKTKKSFSNQVHDDTYTHLTLGNASISQDLHWQMRAMLYVICWNTELHNLNQLILYLLKKPASDGVNLLFVTLNYSSPECNLYSWTLPLPSRLKPWSVFFNAQETEPPYSLPPCRGRCLFLWVLLPQDFWREPKSAADGRRMRLRDNLGRAWKASQEAAALKCWAGLCWIKGRRPPPYALHYDA